MLFTRGDMMETASAKVCMGGEKNGLEGAGGEEGEQAWADGAHGTTAFRTKSVEDGDYTSEQERSPLPEVGERTVGGGQDRQQKVGGGVLQVPSHFCCPLSLELMSDPVIVDSGQTYERSYIQQWLDQGNTTCPKTGQVLTHTNLIPNYTVKVLIENWREAQNVPLPQPAEMFALNTVSKNISPPDNSSVPEPDERRLEPPPPKSVPKPIAIPGRQPAVQRSISVNDSRPRTESRLTFQHGSFDDREFERRRGQNQNGEGGGHRRMGGGETSQQAVVGSAATHHRNGDVRALRISLAKEKDDPDSGNECSSPLYQHHHSRTGSGSSVASSLDSVHGSFTPRNGVTVATASDRTAHSSRDASPYQSDASGEMDRTYFSSAGTFLEEMESPSHSRLIASRLRRSQEREMPRIVSGPLEDSLAADGATQLVIDRLVLDLRSDDVDVQREAAAELRLLAKYSKENCIVIANSGAIKPLVALLGSTDLQLQETAVTALLNLSINDNNKSEIAGAGAIYPLVNVLKVGTPQAMENAAATLFSLSVMDANKAAIGASGAIPPLVHLLINGMPRGKKDAATALFNLSIFHENRGRIVSAGAVKPLVELMADPATGMVDKAVAVLANLSTIPEGRAAIGDEAGIPVLVEAVEAGSQRGKENAAATLLQLCMYSHRHAALVLQEGAIPPLFALSQSGTSRGKKVASVLLRHFKDQRQQGPSPRTGSDNHMGRY